MSGLHGNHDLGHTVAGWTGTAVAVLGFCVTGAALTKGSGAGLALGAAGIVAAALVTWVLHLSGWGKPSGPRPVGEQSWRTKDRTAAEGHPGCLGCRMAGRSVARRSAATGSMPFPASRAAEQGEPIRSAVPATASAAVRGDGGR
ncbi:HGxxPAAW family protein [Streptomyces sp. NPDC048643]|uniref:HGxxPAAW family protein n=1 Tax=Streptomyces sp. NPDC048643 TaxID=3155637 RepID=UPI003449225B